MDEGARGDETLSVIVVNYRREALLEACLRSLRPAVARASAESEVIVVDNGSGDGSCDLVRNRFPEVELVPLPGNRGFAGGVNEGIRRSRGDWVLILNNDLTVEPTTLEEVLAVGRSSPDVGSVAAQMRFADERATINSAGIVIDRLGIAYDRLVGAPATASEAAPTEVFGASAGAALYRRAMLDEVGGLDESFFIFLEDADLAWRARQAGWRCLYAPGAVVHHHHSATAGHGSSLKYFHVGRNRVRMLAKNADRDHLRRYGPAMVAYDLAYVVYAALFDRTLAPARGRLRGLREWSAYRRGAEPRPVELAPVAGFGQALRRRAAWSRSSTGARREAAAP